MNYCFLSNKEKTRKDNNQIDAAESCGGAKHEVYELRAAGPIWRSMKIYLNVEIRIEPMNLLSFLNM